MCFVDGSGVFLSGCSNTAQSEYDDLWNDYDSLLANYDSLSENYDKLKVDYDAKTDELEKTKKSYNSLKSEYDGYKLETADYLEMSEIEREAAKAEAEAKRIEAEVEKEKAQAERERLEEEKKAEEEAKRKEEEEARLAEEAKGYDTGISYAEIARNPDDYKGKKVKFTGYVQQVVEGTFSNAIRMSTSGMYDDIIYANYSSSIEDGRLLDDDHLTVYGTVKGLKSYTAVLGNTITIPEINVDRIELID